MPARAVTMSVIQTEAESCTLLLAGLNVVGDYIVLEEKCRKAWDEIET